VNEILMSIHFVEDDNLEASFLLGSFVSVSMHREEVAMEPCRQAPSR